MESIAIVGMACRYPDASSPTELFENVLAQRRAFRRIPDERLRLADYFSNDRNAPDRTYSQFAAVIEGYEFDRMRFRVSGPAFRSVDLTHWLALDVASQALNEAGFADGKGLPREATGVYLGNTLAGEFARANVMRLRWPYVRRVVESNAAIQRMAEEERAPFLAELESEYKSAFPPVGEETLAGGMSNTIAGRICNYFDLNGGGYTVDGACASSLLAVTTAASALSAGDLDVAIAGGVDLSLDPFELIGFAKTGALAGEKMLVFDERSAGFWPGEGCGIIVLMRLADALDQGRKVHAVIRGWGVSSDGSGGMTRPDVEGQSLAIRRAYRRAGFGPHAIGYFEAHGTGTALGDTVELTVLSRARSESAATATPAVVSTIKANIGHTKAAAGIAGLIKAAMAVKYRVLPPLTGCDSPHPLLRANGQSGLRVLRRAERWPQDQPARAAVSAMGFGGINAHLVIENSMSAPNECCRIPAAPQDAECFFFSGHSGESVLHDVRRVAQYAMKLSESQLADLAAKLASEAADGKCRAAVVARSAQELAARLQRLTELMNTGSGRELDVVSGVFYAETSGAPCIGFLFPGQGSPSYPDGNSWPGRFSFVEELYREVAVARAVDERATEVAQPAIMRATLAGLRTLAAWNIAGVLGVGHSLGELAALHWAGAFDERALLRIAEARGSAMAGVAGPVGAMASLAAAAETVGELIGTRPVVIAALNSPAQTVISGEGRHVEAVVKNARDRGVNATVLNVSHAFHSPLVAGAVQALRQSLTTEQFAPLKRTVISTVTGKALDSNTDVRPLICGQVTSPVRFAEAAGHARGVADLWVELGPGSVLSRLAQETTGIPAISVDAGGASFEGLLKAAGAAFALGCPVRREALFEDRVVREFPLDWKPKFFRSPCESAPIASTRTAEMLSETRLEPLPAAAPSIGSAETAAGVVRELVAARSELPLENVKPHFRMLSDLHLNSIVTGQIVAEAARRLGIPPPIAPGEYADARVSELAEALEHVRRTGVGEHGARAPRVPDGVDAWIRCFRMELVEQKAVAATGSAGSGGWSVFGDAAGSFRSAFAEAPGHGVVVCLLAITAERAADILLEASGEVLRDREGNRFVVVQNGAGGAFARSLHLEYPDLTCCVVDVSPDHPMAPKWAVQEALAASGYSEAHYDRDGVRRVPRLKLVRPEDSPIVGEGLSSSDVLLATGGGKGIGAECALDLARHTGARVALLGRSVPEEDADLSENLQRFAASGVSCRYFRADVGDAGAVREAVRRAEEALGPITAVLHAAGINAPQLIPALNSESFRRMLKPKVDGLRNVLAAIKPERVRLVVSFGSLIARTGLRGEAHYGVANEWLRTEVECWRDRHPGCRCLHLDWSVWAGAGMGERLGRLDALMQQGVTPIPIEEGVRILRELTMRDTNDVSLLIAGRFGNPPTIHVEEQELPFLRFLENVRTFVRGVELITDVELSGDSDLYLDDHVYEGERLLPGVMGLEAMAEVSMVLLNADKPPAFEDVEFKEAIVVPLGKSTTVRIAALVTEPGRCSVVIRSDATGFQVDHFRATCVRQNPEEHHAPEKIPETGDLPLDPATDIYGRLLFHSGRFRRLRAYKRLHATECVAEIGPARMADWFWRYLPSHLVLGDPGGRDAAIHAIQCCIPQASLLPYGVRRISTGVLSARDAAFVLARERETDGLTFVYDLEVVDAAGTVLEVWEGLRLRRIRDVAVDQTPPVLLGPFFERMLGRLLPGWDAAVAVEPASGGGDRRTRSNTAVRRVTGKFDQVLRRPDGKPEIPGSEWHVSTSHSDDVTVAVAGVSVIACDVERVMQRPRDVWKDLLGWDRFTLAGGVNERGHMDFDIAATHVWAASECLAKAGAVPGSPLVLEHIDGAVLLLRCGPRTIATVALANKDEIRVFAFLRSSASALCANSNFAMS